MTADAPFILTLALDERSSAFFDGQRRRYFPPERNFIPAHLTLFHKLPAEHETAIVTTLHGAADGQAPIVLKVIGLRSLGRGVAYSLASPELAQFRLSLAKQWALWLTLQDRQKHQPHVTIQNKVDPQDASALLADLAASFEPFTVTGTGLDLWRYRGGPWEKAESFPFTAR
jgi:2'-5' RNA ligase